MKISIRELRSLIREALIREESTVPGKWSGDGAPTDPGEVERLPNKGERSDESDDCGEGR
jgi:hypothetical protein